MRKLTLTPALLIWLGLIAISAGLLYMNGRSLICPCGTLEFYDMQRAVGQDSQHFLDIYSFTHVLHGILIYFLVWLVGRGRVPFLAGLLIATVIEGGWELFENSQYIIDRYKDTAAAQLYNGDSVINAVGDIIMMSVGFLLAARLPVWASIAVLIGVEVVLALLIRDNLTLSFLSLVHPVEAVSQWQEGG
jgi:hypothetical protein